MESLWKDKAVQTGALIHKVWTGSGFGGLRASIHRHSQDMSYIPYVVTSKLENA